MAAFDTVGSNFDTVLAVYTGASLNALATVGSNADIGGGIAPSRITCVVGITKAYTTRVGSGPFPTELEDSTGELLRKRGNEYGATTGRPRRCGWFDANVVRYSVRVNGLTGLAVTKLDVLDTFGEIPVGTGYTIDGELTEELPAEPIWLPYTCNR